MAALGTDSDARVAAALGLGHGSVVRKRRLLGIPASRPRTEHIPGIDWTPDLIARLGTKPDKTLAVRIGVTAPTLLFRRRLHGIAAYVAAPDRIEWTLEMDDALGTMTDTKFAERYGVSVSSVKHRRRERGAEASRPWPGIVESTGDLEQLLEMPNRELLAHTRIGKGTASRLRRELGIDMSEVHARKWTPEVLARLGVDSNSRIASDMGLTNGAVRHKRIALGIATGVSPGRPPGRRSGP